MKKIILAVFFMLVVISFSEMTPETINKNINEKNYDTAAKNLVQYYKENGNNKVTFSEAEKAVMQVSKDRENLKKYYKGINKSNYNDYFSETMSKDEISKLLKNDGVSLDRMIKELNNLKDENFLIDLVADSPTAEYGIYGLRYMSCGVKGTEDAVIILEMIKKGSVSKIGEVMDYGCGE